MDFDESVLAFVNGSSGGALHELDLRDPHTTLALARLRHDCISAKEALTTDTETVLSALLPTGHFDVRLTREEFEGLVRAPIESTIGALNGTLRSGRIAPDQLAAVLLLGGSSRIPLVARMVREELGRPVVDTQKHVVALGAAALAGAVVAAEGQEVRLVGPRPPAPPTPFPAAAPPTPPTPFPAPAPQPRPLARPGPRGRTARATHRTRPRAGPRRPAGSALVVRALPRSAARTVRTSRTAGVLPARPALPTAGTARALPTGTARAVPGPSAAAAAPGPASRQGRHPARNRSTSRRPGSPRPDREAMAHRLAGGAERRPGGRCPSAAAARGDRGRGGRGGRPAVLLGDHRHAGEQRGRGRAGEQHPARRPRCPRPKPLTKVEWSRR